MSVNLTLSVPFPRLSRQAAVIAMAAASPMPLDTIKLEVRAQDLGFLHSDRSGPLGPDCPGPKAIETCREARIGALSP